MRIRWEDKGPKGYIIISGMLDMLQGRHELRSLLPIDSGAKIPLHLVKNICSLAGLYSSCALSQKWNTFDTDVGWTIRTVRVRP